ncbi:ABC transporter ATP-binding protein [Proteiniclasticum ruminis]|uniref:Branched-chain amino acid transport system ATP-binding protein n=1 Tax=Proteiniclasticum ruminis TaxID=398199 RepID=A0A1G8G840_9CLOT|nr:ABC transporter ATP-binding protein [Proteiniclasticum ruminis]MBP9920761.1 ABC transporter ATP-binding protein [Proteiniclasticum sp.]SDH90441.1 branched-chain amino acid transport system ATP-binding protein [Proteiniclasticum ruminis]
MLKLENLSVHYGAIEALKNLSLEVHKGEIVSLIGANGAGKTTTLRTISGLEKKTSGNILLLGEDLSKVSSSAIVRKGISHIPEGRRVFPKMTVEENLELGAITRKDKIQVQKDFEKAYLLFPRLRERKHQIAGTLSGGEQQMLAIARGLLSKPQLLILDEPSMGLAPIIVHEIFEIIKNINEEGTTILLVEQNANLALKISKRSYIIKTGTVETEGFSKDLLAMDEIRKAYLGG